MNESGSLKFCFKTFERVLVRNTNVSFRANWIPNIYLYTSEGMHRFLRGPDTHETHCEVLPYEGNEYLVGTNGFATTPWKPKEGELVAVSDDKEHWYSDVFIREADGLFSARHCPQSTVYNLWKYCEPLRNHFNVPEE